MYRYFKRSDNAEIIRQLAVPRRYRKQVLKLGHDCVMAGHMGVRKTYDRIMQNFYWPGIFGDVKRFCRSCDICQRTVDKGTASRAPVQNMPLVNVAFDKVSIDLIGPISPMSERGHRYILTMVDFATRYPEAIPLRTIDSESIAEALVNIFSRVGVPRVLLSDNGPQFVSDIMQEVTRLLSIKLVHSTIYHPMSNGLVEKFNGTIKRMLRRMSVERPRDWDRYIEPLLFAYREAPQASTGFSPFELLYGRTVRGPMEILREVWTGDKVTEETRCAYEYVIDLRNRIESTCRLASENLKEAAKTYKKHFDKRAKMRNLNVGDEVLILLPTDNNKLLMQWKGPFSVTEKVGPTDYRIQVGKLSKLFHINMLKQYLNREETVTGAFMAIVDDEEDEIMIDTYPGVGKEGVEHIHISDELCSKEVQEMKVLIAEFSCIFTDIPGCTDIICHEIKLDQEKPVRLKPYPMPFSKRECLENEVDKMIALDIIEPSNSPFCSPMLLVMKSDGSFRPVIDYRKLNKVSIFDAEPIPNPDEIFNKLTSSLFYSKVDFCSGYWQIPMKVDDREKPAFATSKGLFQFKRMPFGLVNAGATYTRMMRLFLGDVLNVENYIDDVLIHSDSWEIHLRTLRKVFVRIRDAHLTIKPSKCFFGYTNVEFLGHSIRRGMLETQDDNIRKILDAVVPLSKKQVRSFLGLTGFYHRFIPHYAHVASPLSDLTKGGMPERVVWTEEANEAFIILKKRLCDKPVLYLPDLDRSFVLRTDASEIGLGAMLLQEFEGVLHHIAYASKKLNHAQRAYATLERECLAIVWGVQKFNRYLFGLENILQTDHQALKYLNTAKYENNRVMRWALKLQAYRFLIQDIPGKENVGADFLSR